MQLQPQPLIVSGKVGTRLPPETVPFQPVVYGARGLLLDCSQQPPMPIRFVRWANLATGEYEAFRSDPKETNRLARCLRQAALQALIYRSKTRLQWLPTSRASEPASMAAKVDPPRPSPPPWRTVAAERVVAIAGRRCQRYACIRLADWMVSEEVELPPAVAGGTQYERADCRRVRWWCNFHYQPPTLYDAKGELITKQEVEARPE